jgi:iron complex transport system substrate-binding protein
LAVHAFNQRTVAGILDMIRLLAAMIGASAKGVALADDLCARLDAVRRRAAE